MAVFMKGDMWSVFGLVDHFVITTNSTIKKNGAVVMGAGIAKQVRDKWPGIDVEIGNAINGVDTYGLILGSDIGVFQVKHFWGDDADVRLIKYSTMELAMHAVANPDRTYALNFPGIGNGGLPYEVVKPIVDVLPDNVQVWTFN